jgi:hypothetical protein
MSLSALVRTEKQPAHAPDGRLIEPSIAITGADE